MSQLTSELIILEDGQAPPSGVKTPPRQPKWSDTFAYIANPDRFCRENLAKYGPIFQTSIFGGISIVVGSAKANQMAFNGDLKYTELGLPATTMDMFGEYSLFQRPDLHQQRKSALRPGLAGQTLDRYTPRINQGVNAALPNWTKPDRISLFSEVEQTCFDILVPLLWGIRLDDADPTTFAGLPFSSKAELKALYKTFFDGFFGLVRWKSPLTAYGRGVKARERLIEGMRALIRQRRAHPDSIDASADFLSMMLIEQAAHPDGVFSDALMENQCLLQLWASHYEISGLVASWIYLLGQYPNFVQQLRAEQARIVGEGSNPVEFTPEHLKQMTFLEATLKETLRLLPPSSAVTRQLTKSVVLDGVLYEKGWKIMPETRVSHFMPEYFHDPDQFIPQRFLPDSEEGKMYEFIPFGGGVHACLGAQMAMTFSKVFAAQVLRQINWQSLGTAEFVQFPLHLLKPSYQIPVQGRSH